VHTAKYAGVIMAMHLAISFLLQAFAAFYGLFATKEVMGGMVGFFAGGLIMRGIFRYLIPTKCPNPSCGAFTAYQRGSQPITYVCSKCGHTHYTKVSEECSDNFLF
jgi:hypothetical protein